MGNNMNEGWVKLYRSLLDHPRFRDGAWLKVWLFLLCRATHAAYRVVFEGKDTMLQPGQLITSRQTIVDFCKVERSKVERILKKLESEHQIEQLTTSACRLITITNWDRYQRSEQPIEQQVSNDRATSEQRVSTHKNGKKVENDKNHTVTPWPGAEVVEAWNSAGLMKCVKVTDKRREHLNARLKSPFFVQHWRQALTIISESDFCQGRGTRGWKANFDWFIRSDDAVTNAVEGKYGGPVISTQTQKFNPVPPPVSILTEVSP